MDNYKVSKVIIYGLFENKKVEVDFSNSIQIFTGENGIGKTTILNIIYNTLTLNYKSLKELPFDTISVIFENEKSLMFRKEWLSDYADEALQYKNYYTKQMINILRINEESEEKNEDKRHNENFKKISRNLIDFDASHVAILQKLDELDSELISSRVPDSVIIDEYLSENAPDYYYSDDNFDYHHISEANLRMTLFSYIMTNFYNEEILYFPTYRRIEEELSKIQSNSDEEIFYDYDQLSHRNDLISFGLSDVEELFESIEEDIKEFNLEGYSLINTELLTYMLNPHSITNEMIEKINDKNSVRIVLDRMEENTLNKKDKDLINQKLNDMDFLNATSGTDTVIIYFLYKLIERYEMKSDQENAIKLFVKVCNRYLVN